MTAIDGAVLAVAVSCGRGRRGVYRYTRATTRQLARVPPRSYATTELMHGRGAGGRRFYADVAARALGGIPSFSAAVSETQSSLASVE
jgi:hypothetical protein